MDTNKKFRVSTVTGTHRNAGNNRSDIAIKILGSEYGLGHSFKRGGIGEAGENVITFNAVQGATVTALLSDQKLALYAKHDTDGWYCVRVIVEYLTADGKSGTLKAAHPGWIDRNGTLSRDGQRGKFAWTPKRAR